MSSFDTSVYILKKYLTNAGNWKSGVAVIQLKSFVKVNLVLNTLNCFVFIWRVLLENNDVIESTTNKIIIMSNLLFHMFL